ncbi:TIGR01777 family protein [Parvibium lacunae]|uniref:TIGR01777 family protein n=2 Tax=Parvibium lacunae TaxID=1888893 RepID=A0A368L526_9BURK|nr:TIGR01777 family protein [Parvibium lacunae]
MAGQTEVPWASQHILITGGSGFIGQHLTRRWLGLGAKVTVLTRRPQKTQALYAGTDGYERLQVVSALAAIEASERIDWVVNLAGAPILGPRWTAARQQTLLASRVQSTQALTAWLQTRSQLPRLVLSASAIGYYGIQPAGDMRSLAEDSPPQPIFMSTLCQRWEAAAQVGARWPVAIFRLGVVLGRQQALPMMLLPIKLGLGGRLGQGNQWLSWIHITDVVRAIEWLVQRHLQGEGISAVYNLTAPQPITQLEFAHTAGALYRRPVWFSTPAWSMRTLLGEQADLLLEGQRVVPQRLLNQGFVFDYPSLQVALADLQA